MTLKVFLEEKGKEKKKKKKKDLVFICREIEVSHTQRECKSRSYKNRRRYS